MEQKKLVGCQEWIRQSLSDTKIAHRMIDEVTRLHQVSIVLVKFDPSPTNSSWRSSRTTLYVSVVTS